MRNSTIKLGIVVPELYYIKRFWQNFSRQLAELRGVDYKIYTEVEKEPGAINDRGNWVNQHISRLVEVRNRLINAAIADGMDLIYMIDDDVYLMPGTLSSMVGYITAQDANVPLVVGAAVYSVEFNKLLTCDYGMANALEKLPQQEFFVLPAYLWLDQNWLMRTADLKRYFPSGQYIPNRIWEMLEFCKVIRGMGWQQVLYAGQLGLCDVEVYDMPEDKKMVKPESASYWEEYSQSYVSIDVNGKTVLDIGGDFGSSAVWFLRHGAKKVIVYTRDEPLLFDDRIEYHGAWNGEYVPADVLKIDCEGCECLLSRELIEKYEHYYIAAHIFAPCFEAMVEYLGERAKVVFTTKDGVEVMYAR